MQVFMLSTGIRDATLVTQIENRLKQSLGTPNLRTIAQLRGRSDNHPIDDDALRHVLVRSDVPILLCSLDYFGLLDGLSQSLWRFREVVVP